MNHCAPAPLPRNTSHFFNFLTFGLYFVFSTSLGNTPNFLLPLSFPSSIDLSSRGQYWVEINWAINSGAQRWPNKVSTKIKIYVEICYRETCVKILENTINSGAPRWNNGDQIKVPTNCCCSKDFSAAYFMKGNFLHKISTPWFY